MTMTRRRNVGLGSRVAFRTYLLFCLCSIAPVVLFAGFGYRYMKAELHSAAQARLDAASKRYGVLVFERLNEADAFLAERAHLSLQGVTGTPERTLSSERVRVLSIQDAAPGARIGSALEIATVGGVPTVQVRVTASDGRRALTIVGEPVPEYLWNVDATDVLDVGYCVYAGAARRPLRCAGGDLQPVAGEQRLVGKWDLFLRSRYGTSDWIIRAEQPLSAALPALGTFKTTLLVSAALAVGIALLIGSIQIRRSHRPLAVLAAATQQMGRGHLGAQVAIAGHDEYAGLGRAFNRMAGNLHRHFQLLSAFARIDRLMLARPAVEPIIEALLPRVRTLLHCEVAAIVLHEPSGDARVYAAGPAGLALTRIRTSGMHLRTLGGSSAKWLPVSFVAREELQFLDAPELQEWLVAPIRVAAEHRGLLLLGFDSRPAHSGRTRRHASSLAHRVAVALGNEDRERALLQQAYYDSLTGLPNRQLFRDRLEQQLAHARRSGEALALLFIDLDRFKNVNDSLGHGAGDELLQSVAARLAGVVDETRTLARLGGDEFTVIAPVPGIAAAGALAAQILEVLRAPITVGGMQCVAQASVGIAVYPEDGATAETLIRNADTAMYKAKALGRGTAVFFEDKMSAQAVRRLQLEQRLHMALERDELEQCYQLKVRAADAAPVGFEALARWTDPELGPVNPLEFIAVAEESGMIALLDRWSLRTACRNARRWHDMGLDVGHLAVNVSLRHLDQTFVEFLADCLAEFAVPVGALELEITESTLADRPDEAKRVLEAVRALGVRIAIDDFGTGYSSMAVLQKMPIDILKIDRAFVTRCADNEDAAALLKAMINIAAGLRKEVVAEGVETPAQAAFLRAHGCQYLQGFLYARPVNAAMLERDLRVDDTRQRA